MQTLLIEHLHKRRVGADGSSIAHLFDAIQISHPRASAVLAIHCLPPDVYRTSIQNKPSLSHLNTPEREMVGLTSLDAVVSEFLSM